MEDRDLIQLEDIWSTHYAGTFAESILTNHNIKRKEYEIEDNLSDKENYKRNFTHWYAQELDMAWLFEIVATPEEMQEYELLREIDKQNSKIYDIKVKEIKDEISRHTNKILKKHGVI